MRIGSSATRTVASLAVVIALTTALATTLTGCGGRFGQAQNQEPAIPPSSSAPAPTASNDSLTDVESDLREVDGATTQSGSDLDQGDQAANQSDE
jgi:hypothetical protein